MASRSPDLDAHALAALRRRLLAWYDREHRELPWRATNDPWAILVSEVMLQQTTVAAVIPYYERFLARWPDAAALASARRDQLLAEWAGLGYYRRAENLHRAASVVAESGGTLPGDRDGLAQLPGVGRYTAAAVASIAYGEPVAAVDGNVERVLSRVFAIGGDLRKAAGRRAIGTAADALLSRRRPGDHNQALMELGARVCRPTSPRCEDCPLASRCGARTEDRPERYPERPPRRTQVEVHLAAALVRRSSRVLLLRRDSPPNDGFLELPAVTLPHVTADGRAALASHLRDRYGLTVQLGRALETHRHTITHHRIHVQPFTGRHAGGRVRAPLAWADPSDLAYPLTTATRRILTTQAGDAAPAGR